MRLRLPQTKSTLVPSAATRAAAIPAMQPFVSAFPAPTGPDRGDGLAPAVGGYSDPSSLDAASLRLDYSPSQNWNFFGRYNHAPSSTSRRSADPTIDISLNSVEQLETTTRTLTLGATTLISPRLTNELRFNYSRYGSDTAYALDDFGGAVPFNSSLVFPSGVSFANGTFQLLLLTPPNPLLLAGPVAKNLQRQFNVVDSVTFSQGTHLLKFGVDYRRLSPIQNPLTYLQQAIFPDAGFLANGLALLFGVHAGRQDINYNFTNWSFFAQDTWRATSRMTVTYGIRWDINPVPTTAGDTPEPRTLQGLENVANLDPATLTDFAPAGTPLYQTSHSDFAPRIGIAYPLRQSENWASLLRGGFGVFYDVSSSVYGNTADGFPNRASRTSFFVAFPATPAEIAPPELGDPTFPISGITVVDPDLKSPYSLQWNVAYEQQLGAEQSVSMTYVGAVGRRLVFGRQFSFPSANFDFVDVYLNGATSDYNALQVQFQRRLSRGLQALASYTWAHAIDQDSNTVGLTGLARGSANFDIRHSFSGALSYALPRPRWGAVPDAILRNWTVNVPFRAQSAAPVDLVGNFNVNLSEFRVYRPNIVPGQPFYVDDPAAPGGRRINDAAFTPAPDDVQGNLGRNVLRGLGSWQIDLTLQRDFSLIERVKFLFRTELFNIFKHPNFGLPEGRLGRPNFGVPTQTLAQSLGQGGTSGGFNPLYQVGGPRSIQFALKLQF